MRIINIIGLVNFLQFYQKYNFILSYHPLKLIHIYDSMIAYLTLSFAPISFIHIFKNLNITFLSPYPHMYSICACMIAILT